MEKLCVRITDADFFGGEAAYLETPNRVGARGLLTDENGNVAMMYMAAYGFYKLPGGGLESGESKEEAFIREIKEETGCTCDIIEQIGVAEEHKNQNDFFQRSFVFIAKLISRGENALTEKEQSLGFGLQWLKPEEAIEKVAASLEKCGIYSTKFVLKRDLSILRFTHINKLI